MTIQGNLGTIGQGTDNLMRSIHRDRLTGRLSIFYENEQRRNVQDVIFIDQGMIIGLKSLDKYGVKELLIYAGKLTREQAEEATQKAAASAEGKTAEQILLEEGVITRELVIHSIATLIRGCIQRILTKPYGLYIFHPSPELKGVKAMTRISALQMILDYARALKKPDIYASVLPNTEAVATLAVNVEDIRKRYHLTDEEWRILYLVNGERTLREIMQESGFEEERSHRVLYTLIMGDFLRVGSGTASVEMPSAGMLSGAMPAPPAPSPSGTGYGQVSSVRIPAPPSGTGTSSVSAESPSAPSVESPAAPPPPPAIEKNKGTILVVDDSKTIQKMVELALKDMPYKLVMADDGFMALELAPQVHPDLVILDVIMPKLDGYKTCGQLRRVLAPRKVPVIMLTARDGAFDKIKGRLAGASMYMAKPFESEDLQAAVNKFMADKG
jgi:twitching motility two-component system response regulator PilG